MRPPAAQLGVIRTPRAASSSSVVTPDWGSCPISMTSSRTPTAWFFITVSVVRTYRHRQLK